MCVCPQRLDASLKKATPWLVLAGSGPAADLISELRDNLSTVPLSPASSPPAAEGEAAQGLSSELRDKVRDKVRKHFPSEADVERLVDSVSRFTPLRDEEPCVENVNGLTCVSRL